MASRMGVLAQEDMAEGERTRFARRKVKNAVIGRQSLFSLFLR